MLSVANVCVRHRPQTALDQRRARPACRSTRNWGVSISNESSNPTVEPGALVLVPGATGGVGQLVVAKLLERGYRVRALVRSTSKAKALFGADVAGLELFEADARKAASLQGFADGAAGAICCLGTTAFPSARWKDDNGPEQTDFVAVSNVVAAAKAAAFGRPFGRFLLLSSIGVTRTNVMPFLVLNLGGVLKWKALGEQALRDSGLPWTILRPGRLTDGPYTSYDLNTLLKATSGTKRRVVLQEGDTLLPDASSRLAVAEAAVQALSLGGTAGKAFVLGTTEGDGPRDKAAWAALFGVLP